MRVMSDTHATKAIKKKWRDVPPGTLRGPMGLPVSYNLNAYEGNKTLAEANKGVLRSRAHSPTV